MGLLVTGALTSLSTPVLAAAFNLYVEKAGATVGLAGAGAGSIAEDASTNSYNAAGLTRLGEEQVVFSAVGILPDSKFTATKVTDNTGVARSTGRTKVRGNSLVPAFHYARRICDNLVFGFSADSPWGLKTLYKQNSVARYMATRSELQTVNLGPSLAYAFDNGLSVGAGVDALYAYAKLNSRTGATVPGPRTLADGTIENTADAWGLGWHVGLLYEISDCTRVGVQFRSKVKVKLKGETIVSNPGFPAAGPEQIFDVRARVTLPETLLLSAYHDLTEQWALMGDISWVRWKRFKELTLKSDTAPIHSVTTQERYKDTYRVAAGTTYQFTPEWRGKVGVAYDRSPTRNKFRTARIPDSNRTWLGLGAQYRFSECAALELGYAHVFFKKARLNESAPAVLGPAQLTGRYRTGANLLGLQFTWDIA